MVRSGLLLGVGNGSVAILGLIRNILIARLVSVEDFGIASTFAITMAMIEMASGLGSDQFIVQDKDGDKPVLQSTAQAFMAVRGFIIGAILFLLAGPIATVFRVPELVWAYQAIALFPIIRGMAHLDIFRFQRSLRFAPVITVELGATLVSTLVAGIAAFYFADYRAMLCALLAQQVAYLIVSHIVAERAYGLGWNKDVARRTINFGWPLLINGLLMFGIFQGDRVIVANQMGIQVLGWFAVAFALTLMPTTILSKVLTSLSLPRLSKLQDDEAGFNRLATLTIEFACAVGVLLVIGFAVLGRPMMLALYGVKYEAALAVLVWLAVMQSLRVAKAGPTIIALAGAQTKNPMFANLARICFLPIAFLAAVCGAEVLHLVWIATLGELCALFVAFQLLGPRLGSAIKSCKRAFIGTILILAAVLANESLYPVSEGNINLPSFLVLAVLVTAYLVFFLPNLTRSARSYLVNKG